MGTSIIIWAPNINIDQKAWGLALHLDRSSVPALPNARPDHDGFTTFWSAEADALCIKSKGEII